MDTCAPVVRTDTLGRRVATRRRRSVEEKARIVAQSREPGASVAEVARQHGVNANQVFAWRRLRERGLLGEVPSPLLPVQVVAGPEGERPVPAAARPRIEIVLPDRTRVVVFGKVSSEQLEPVLRLLRR